VRWQEGESGRLWRLDKEVGRFSIAIYSGLAGIFLKTKVLSALGVAQWAFIGHHFHK